MKKSSKGLKVLTASALLSLTLAAPIQALAQESSEAVMVPLRYVAESIGAKVEWDNDNRQAIVFRGPLQLIFTIGEQTALLNQQSIPLSAKAEIKDSKTYVPLDAFHQILNVNVDWNADAGIKIDTTDTTTIASYFLHLLQTGQWQEAEAMISDELKSILPPGLLQMYFTNFKAMFGTPEQLVQVELEENQVHLSAKLTYSTKENNTLGMIVRFDTDGKVAELFAPYMPTNAYVKPDYEKENQYIEKDVVIGEGEFALPGKLTLPVGEGPFPVVVLVHGSGTNDRDESIGAGKPFRDLAVGLASKKIAVLRYDKRTFEHNLKIALGPDAAQITVKEETIDDALAAVKLLKEEKLVDPSQIYVLGHSQGGMLVPRMIEADQDQLIAGAIIMAGPSVTPLEDIILDQLNKQMAIAEQQGVPTDAFKQEIQGWEQFLTILKDEQYSVDNLPPIQMANLKWWFDLRNYRGAEIAKNQNVPLFIIQGDNDVQVPAEELEGWKKELASRKDIEYKLYPKLNHMMIEFDQPSTGIEYYMPGNVPEYVIDDLIKWIKSQKK